MKKLLFIITFTITHQFLFAKDKAFGLNISTISGMGLSYQFEYDKNITFQLNGFGYYFGDKPPDEMTILGNLGVECQYNLEEYENSRYFLFAGASYWKKEDRFIKNEKVNDIIVLTKVRSPFDIYNFGIGVGYEYMLYGPVKISCNIGLQYQSSIAQNIGILIDLNPSGKNYFGAGGAIGIHVGF